MFPLAVASFLVVACTPALDWRTVKLPDTTLEAQLPCRPGRFQREVVVAGQPLKLFMLSCEAGGATYGLATADVGDVRAVDAVLSALGRSARESVHGRGLEPVPFQLHGATPFSSSASARFQGRRPDGATVEESVRLFARGTRVFEASVIGARLPDSATRPFEDGLRFALENADADPR